MTREVIIGIGVLALLALGGTYAYFNYTPNTDSVSSNVEETEVRKVVTEFGGKLQMVSLLAPEAERRAAMELNYGAYVSPELLAYWYPEGVDSLGRYASSPWPSHIDIVEIRPEGAKFIVEGNVLEVANSSGASSTVPVAVYPVTLTLEKRGAVWLIVDAQKGAYSQLPHSQTIVGFWECLPHKDTSGPQTMECAFGIAVDQSDGHFAIDTSLMATYPVDFPTGTKVRVTGIVTPANQLSSPQKYDIDGIIRATTIEKI